MKFFPVFSLFLFTICFSAEPGVKRELTDFHDMHFGIRFSHSDAITTTYVPHGGANLIPMAWKGKTVGALHVRKLPPSSSDDEFITSGKAYFAKEFNAISVDHRFHESPNRYEFHVFTIHLAHDGKDFVVERFMYQKRSKAATLAGEMIAEQFGSFEFEFLVPKADFVSLEPEIRTIIDTFKLE